VNQALELAGKKRSNFVVQTRRQLVLRYYLMVLDAAEIARNTKTPLRTIQRHLEEIRVWITQQADAEKLRTLKQAILTWQLAQKEMWILYHRPTSPGESEPKRKLGAMGHIIAINRQLDDLLLRPPTSELLQIRTEFQRMSAEYESAKRNGFISG